MHLLSRLIGLNILVVMVGGTMMLGGKIGIYIDIPSIVLIVGALLGGSLLCFSLEQLADAFKAVVQGPDAERVPAWQQQVRAAVFGRLYLLSWGSGLVGTLIGVIAMLSDLSDPASIGSGIAVALLTAFYGAMLAELVFGPMQQTLLNQPPLDGEPGNATSANPTPAGQQSAAWKGAAVIAFMLGMFGVIAMSIQGVEDADAEQDSASQQPQDPSVDPRVEPIVYRADEDGKRIE
jgi:flagellar motor component MotA